MKADKPPSTPHCTGAGVDRTTTHTDGEMQPLKATPGRQRLRGRLVPLRPPGSARPEGWEGGPGPSRGCGRGCTPPGRAGLVRWAVARRCFLGSGKGRHPPPPRSSSALDQPRLL